MGNQFTKMELRELDKFLRKVYPGAADQDALWGLIEKINQLLKGKHGTEPDSRRGGTDRSV